MSDSRTSPPPGHELPVAAQQETTRRGTENVREFPHSRRSDSDLVRSVRDGSEQALRVIWQRYAETVRRTLRGVLGADECLDDLTQEVFLSLVRQAHGVNNPERLRSYLCGIALRQARNKRRERARRSRWMGLFAQADRERTSPVVHHRAALRRLDEILAELPDRLRESFVLRFVEGIPTAEVAEARGVSLATAKRDVARAQERVVERARRDDQLATYLGERVPKEPHGDPEPSGVPRDPGVPGDPNDRSRS